MSPDVAVEKKINVGGQIPYRTVPYRTVPYHTVPYQTELYYFLKMWNFILYRTVPYNTVPAPPQIPTNLPLKNVPEDVAVEGDVEAGCHG